MTIGVVIIGFLLYKSLSHWRSLYSVGPMLWSLDTLYNGTLKQMESESTQITNYYMSGHLRDYLTYIFGFFLLAVGGSLVLLVVFHLTCQMMHRF